MSPGTGPGSRHRAIVSGGTVTAGERQAALMHLRRACGNPR